MSFLEDYRVAAERHPHMAPYWPRSNLAQI